MECIMQATLLERQRQGASRAIAAYDAGKPLFPRALALASASRPRATIGTTRKPAPTVASRPAATAVADPKLTRRMVKATERLASIANDEGVAKILAENKLVGAGAFARRLKMSYANFLTWVAQGLIPAASKTTGSGIGAEKFWTEAVVSAAVAKR
jgi:hypothetical protein